MDDGMDTSAEGEGAVLVRKRRKGIYVLPNLFTLARLVLAIVVFVLVPWHCYWASFVVFVIAAAMLGLVSIGLPGVGLAATVFVAGSAVYRAEDPAEAVLQLRALAEGAIHP